MDLAIDLGATSLHGWRPNEPLLARIDRPPHFDIIDNHGPHPAALAIGMLTSMLMFATFTLLLQPKLPNAPAHLSGRSGSDISDQPGPDMRRAASNHSAQQAIADPRDPEAHHELIAAIAANLKQRYVDRAIGQQLANALLAHDKKGEYASLDRAANFA